MNNGIIVHNARRADYFRGPGLLRLHILPSGRIRKDLHIPVKFSYLESDMRKNRAEGFILSAFDPPAGTYSLLWRLYQQNGSCYDPTWSSIHATAVIDDALCIDAATEESAYIVMSGDIYDFQTRTLQGGMEELQVCVMP